MFITWKTQGILWLVMALVWLSIGEATLLALFCAIAGIGSLIVDQKKKEKK